MSNYIPLEIQAEIMKRLPVKSVIQFRSVSKAWKSLISSSKFIANYNVHETRHHHYLIVNYTKLTRSTIIHSQVPSFTSEVKYVSVLDDDSFPQLKSDLSIPISVKRLNTPILLGTSQGLFCLCNSFRQAKTAVIWNPSIRKSVSVVLPYMPDLRQVVAFGFGVCSHTSDPKLVKITIMSRLFESFSKTFIPWQVEVFTLSSGVWRNLYINLPRQSCALRGNQVVINGFIYWVAIDRADPGNRYQWNYLIILFDLKREEFSEVYLPDSLANNHDIRLCISKLKESLVVLETNKKHKNRVYGVWIMDHSSPNSIKKLFNIRVPDASIEDVLGFRSNGEPIIVMKNGFEDQNSLFVYEPYSKHISYIGIYGKNFLASSYMETLLLLDR